ncbi:MAG: Rqc2 family fibronectin-binding protein [Planctomycetota bacterium]|jgi:predicted ribosome quality control (RQC) complex YloA/Tae2 family protein
MALSMAEIEAVVADLKPKLEGGRVERIDQPDRHRLILSVRNGPARYWLLICVHPRFSRLHLLTVRPDHKKPAAGFCNVARQHITGATIRALSQVPDDRIVVLELAGRDRLMQQRRISLVAELIDVGSNLLLLNEERAILGVLFRETATRRRLVPGVRYEPLEPPPFLPDKARANRFARAVQEGDPLSLGRAIQAHYAALEARESLETGRGEVLGMLRTGLKGRQRRLFRIGAALEKARDAETIRRRGELLKIALPRIQPGQSEVVVEDLFDPDRPEVTIELEPSLSPQENMERLFRRYKKAKAGHDRLEERADATRREVQAIEGLLASAEAASSVAELEELQVSARHLGLTLPAERSAAPAVKAARKGPRSFRSVEGLEILVARNQRENQQLTFTIARGNDYWLHVLGWQGPHVVVRKPPEKSVSPETLLDAAHLAIHFSKVRGTDYAEVAYTQCKHVRRIKGGAGKVSYSNASTLRVRLEPERLDRLLVRPD